MANKRKSTKTAGESSLAEAAAATQNMAIESAGQGEQAVAEGVATLQASADVARVGAVALASGASDLTRAQSAAVVSDRLGLISDVVAAAGTRDIEQGAEMLAHSHDIEIMSAVVSMVSEEALERGLTLARIGGELDAVSKVVSELDMPVLAAFLVGRGAQLRDIAADVIIRAASGHAVSHALAATGASVAELGENEMAEGLVRHGVADLAAERSVELAVDAMDLAERGAAKVGIAAAAADVARAGMVVGAAQVGAGSEAIGEARILDVAAQAMAEHAETHEEEKA